MNKKIILLFPGQGSQYVGMDQLPRTLLGNAYVDSVWKDVLEVLHYDLQKIVTSGPAEELTLTQNTQPALVVTSYLYLQVLKTILKNKKIDLVLGHSLGEYSALLAADSLTLKDAVYITHLRGKFMQEAVPAGIGSMMAILKCPKNLIIEACNACSNSVEQVSIANDNSPEQVVISGHASACTKAVDWLQQNVKERFRFLPLQVSAPFHSNLMQTAAEKLTSALSKIPLQPNSIAYVSNFDAHLNQSATSPYQIKKNLIDQVCGTVKWVECSKHIKSDELMIEVGPGSVLSGLAKKILPGCNVVSMDQNNGLEVINSFLVTP